VTSRRTPTAIFYLPLQCEGHQSSEKEIIFFTCPMKLLTSFSGFLRVTEEDAGVYSVPGIVWKGNEGAWREVLNTAEGGRKAEHSILMVEYPPHKVLHCTHLLLKTWTFIHLFSCHIQQLQAQRTVSIMQSAVQMVFPAAKKCTLRTISPNRWSRNSPQTG